MLSKTTVVYKKSPKVSYLQNTHSNPAHLSPFSTQHDKKSDGIKLQTSACRRSMQALFLSIDECRYTDIVIFALECPSSSESVFISKS